MKNILLMTIMSISLNAVAQSEPHARSKEIGQTKEELVLVMDKMPYYKEEHAAIKKYFVEVKSLINEIKNSIKYTRRFNTYLKETGVEIFCEEVLLEESKWEQLIKNCTKNSFFLCSEEVKTYPRLKEELKKSLDKDLQTQMSTNELCR